VLLAKRMPLQVRRAPPMRSVRYAEGPEPGATQSRERAARDDRKGRREAPEDETSVKE
jgi:hypothetical protein